MTASGDRGFVFYVGYAVAWTAAIVAGGALAGVVVFPIVGGLAGADMTASELALSGAKNLGFLAFVWAPGTAIVLAFHRAYRERRRRD